MKKQTYTTHGRKILRSKAEKLLKMKSPETHPGKVESDVLKLIQELQVHQVELEMQNEELTLAKKQVSDLASEKYDELYDFAPTGYYTLSKAGKIRKLNLSGATLLGRERSRLIEKSFGVFVSNDTKSAFSLFLSNVSLGKIKETCEVTLISKGNEPIYVLLSGIATENGEECLVTAADISSRKKVEQMLKQNESTLKRQNEIFSILLKNMQIGVFMVEAPSGKPLLANEKALQLLGRGILPDTNRLNLAEVYKAYKAGSREPYPPDEMPVLMGMYGKSATIDDMIVVRPNGEEVQLEITGSPVINENGDVWASLVTFTDISERKKTEAAIKLSEEKFRSIFDQASVGAAIVDIEKRFLRCNPAFCNFLSYKEEELIGKPISDVTFPEDVTLGMPELKQIAENEIESSTLEKRYLTKDGIIVWGQISINLVRDEKNSPLFFLALIQDITKRKQTEEALKKSEKHFRELADSITDVFFEMDTDLRYTYWNKASEKLLGIKAESTIGKSVHETFPVTPELIKAEAIYREVLNTRQFRIFESIFEHDGNRIVFEIRVYPTEGGIAIFTNDITERKRTEAEIKIKNEELLKSNAEKDKFFSIIAHDLRSPFNAFLGFTRMMEEELQSLSQDEIRDIAISMRKSANMLFHLLENLLEWSRMQRGMGSFQPVSFSLEDAVLESIHLFSDAARKKHIAIRQEVPADILVTADPHMFESILRNLIFNAIKFTPKGGEIAITAKLISNNFIEISVSDTGIGMSREMIKKLFHLNEQTHRKGTEGEPSTGLGLIISKDFIEKHGGTIRIESEEEKGSTFYFTIPCEITRFKKPLIKTIPATGQITNPVKKLKVLIVEDDETSELLLSAAIKTMSKEILNVASGIEAVEICRKNPDIDLILMDIKIPGIDGYEATRQIRTFNTEVIIIAQTAYGLSSDSEEAKKAGCTDYMAKPLNLAFLKELIQKHLIQ